MQNSKGENFGYSYEQAGFDPFLQRSIGGNYVGVLSDIQSAIGGSNGINYDQTQVSGAIGDKIQVGNIVIDGVAGRISVFDTSGVEVVRIGSLDA